MNDEDKEALEMIVERNGFKTTRETIDNIFREKRILFYMEEGISREEATTYYNEIFPEGA